MITRFGLVGGTYQSQSPNADAEFTINLYPEIMESGAGNAPIVLYRTPGTRTFVNLGRTVTPQVDGLGAFDQAGSAVGTGTAVATGSLTPSSTPEFALFGHAKDDISGFTFTPAAGWTTLGGQTFQQVVSAAINGQGTISSTGANWVAALALFKQIGASAPTIVQTATIVSGAWTPGTNTGNFTNPVQAGNAILVVFEGNQTTLDATLTVSDGTNTYAKLVDRRNATGLNPQYTMYAAQSIAAGTPTVSAHTLGVISGQILMYEIQGGTEAVINSGPIRSQIDINGRSFAICGSDFDEIFANGTFTTWGQVANDSLIATMAATPQQILIASAGTAYVFDLMANTLTPIPGVTFDGPVAQAAVCDDFFILTIQDSKEFYVSAPLDATDWVTNGSAIVSVFPDNIVGMLVFQRQIWFDSDTQSVVYYDSGNIFPFDVNPNAFIEAGLAAENTMAIFNNSIAWLGADARGHGKVWLASGYTPTRISNHAIEFAIQGYSRIDDAVAFSYQDQGHEFYFLYFPTPSVAWVYDANTGMWHQQGFWLESVGQFRAPHRWTHAFSFGMHLVGDWQSGKIYQMKIPTYAGGTWTFGDDDGNPIRWVRRSPHVSKMQKRQFFSELQVYCETGLGPVPPLTDGAGFPRSPQMNMRKSTDGGHTFGNETTRDCGQSGQFRTRVRWLQLGRARDLVIEISGSDPIGWRIVDGYLDVNEGTGV
jgi:hypothetical protein